MLVKIRVALITGLLGLITVPAAAQPSASAFVVDTLAGSDGIRDGGPATQGLLLTPYDVVTDGDGNRYIADYGHGRVRKVTPEGVISTVTGTGTLATQFNDGDSAVGVDPGSPAGLAVDAAGNLYVSTSTAQIFRIEPDGRIYAHAGTRYTSGYAGDGGPATSARLYIPVGMDVDGAGNLYVADSYNHRIRKITPEGVITTVAGNGDSGYSGDGGQAIEASLNRPQDVKVDAAGNLFIADYSNHRVRKVGADGVIETVAGNGETGSAQDGENGLAARIGYPFRIEVGAGGRIYIAQGTVVQSVGPDGLTKRVANQTGSGGHGGDGGPAAAASFGTIRGLHEDGDGNLYVCDSSNDRVRMIDGNGVVDTVAGASHYQGDGGPATGATLYQPRGAAAGLNGEIYIADTSNHVVRKVDANGEITTVAGTGVRGFNGNLQPAVDATLSEPCDVAVDAAGNLYIADQGSRLVRKVTPDGMILPFAGDGMTSNFEEGGEAWRNSIGSPQSIAFGPDGNLYIASTSPNKVWRVDAAERIYSFAGDGTIGYSGDGGPAVEAQIDRPSGIFADALGNVFIAGSSRLRKVAADGTISTAVQITGTLSSAVIEPNGYFLITNSNNSRFDIAASDGTVTRYTNKFYDFAGDGGPLDEAKFNTPIQLANAPGGRILVVDYTNERIRALTPKPVVVSEGLLHAASFRGGPFAAGQIVTLFGWNLATEAKIASETPLPVSMAGSTPTFTDSAGATHELREFYAAPTQLNLYLPEGVAPGTGTLRVENIHGYSGSAAVEIAVVAPGLFSMSSDGAGVAAAGAVRAVAGGAQSAVTLFTYDAGQGRFVAVPVDLGPEGDEVYLTLYGTGIRGRSSLTAVKAVIGGVDVPVLYAGPQGEFVGLDQINIGPIPRSLIGAGEVTLTLTVDGVVSNSVTIVIQ